FFRTASVVASADDNGPRPPQRKPIALIGATVHPVSGEAIPNATVVFEAGKITQVGTQVQMPPDVEPFDAAGLHIYPGLIESHSQLGLTEIASVAATNDFQETGAMNANAKAIVAVNPDSELIPVTRAGGVLVALTAPSGGAIAGKAAVIQLDGWTYEEMSLLDEACLVVNWPQLGSGRRGRRPVPTEDADAATSQADQRIKELRQWFDQGRAYLELRKSAPQRQPFDLRLEGLADILAGKTPILVRADRLNEIQTVVAFAVEQNVKLIILGGYDAPMCADLLKKHDIPVIVSAVYRLPQRPSDPYDHSYTLPARLEAAGVRYSISGTDRSESWNVRTLPFHAGTAVAYGLSHDQAIRAITLSAAEILGVSDRVGSIDVGKDATLIITDGSPLDIRTTILAAFIEGRFVDLDNKQTRLYRKYQQRLQQWRDAQ
ncbi:MAG TPA: amidohydrolase family protein, partial [Pirellulaceae bacterium]|nr:amidohydrolase family protein [Pirellulaceae bacterium]